VTIRLSISAILRPLAGAAAALAALLALSGCEDSYPLDLRYPPRTDPLVVKAPVRELPYPDRPGQLPLFTFADLREVHNPLHYQIVENLNDVRDPVLVPAEQRQELYAFLEESFGTPAQPRVQAAPDSELEQLLARARAELKLEPEILERGSVLYRGQCLHCHGLTGNGQGPTARWVNPHPRDYRQGVFKFTSTSQDLGVRKARRDDLLRTLRQGVDGTSMPSFGLLSEQDLEALASYVIHLSMRGQVEYNVLGYIMQTASLDQTVPELAAAFLAQIANNWLEAQASIIEPTPYPYDWNSAEGEEALRKSIERGRDAFLKPGTAGCIACHPNYGRQSTYRFDVWGTMVRPTDLTRGVYRGGRRPVDLYWRIYGGINGALMADFGKALQADAKARQIDADLVWDLVNFLQVLPHEKMRQKYGIQINRDH
jgi:mono/diheme cytochrome c family protein